MQAVLRQDGLVEAASGLGEASEGEESDESSGDAIDCSAPVQVASRFFLRLRALRRRKVQRAARLLLETSKELLAELRKREATRHVDEMMR